MARALRVYALQRSGSTIGGVRSYKSIECLVESGMCSRSLRSAGRYLDDGCAVRSHRNPFCVRVEARKHVAWSLTAVKHGAMDCVVCSHNERMDWRLELSDCR